MGKLTNTNTRWYVFRMLYSLLKMKPSSTGWFDYMFCNCSLRASRTTGCLIFNFRAGVWNTNIWSTWSFPVVMAMFQVHIHTHTYMFMQETKVSCQDHLLFSCGSVSLDVCGTYHHRRDKRFGESIYHILQLEWSIHRDHSVDHHHVSSHL